MSLIEVWYSDKEQLQKILDFRGDNNPDETMPQLKAVLENIELAGEQHVSKRGEMHIENLREFKNNVDGVNDERCSKAKHCNERGKCLISSILQDCCIQTMTNADAVVSCEPTQCLVSLTRKSKTYLTSEEHDNMRQFFSEPSCSNFETISSLVPKLVQMTKEIFKQVNEIPNLDGMWGLSNEDVQQANEDVKKAFECNEISSLIGIMVDLLGSLCYKNKSLMSPEEEFIKDMVNRCDLRSLLQLTEKFMKNGEGLKLKKRLEVKGKRFLSIMKGEDNGIYLVRDHGNLAFGLIEFARFHASHIVSFSASVNEEKLIAPYGVSYDEDQRVFVQSFEIMTTQETQKTQNVVCFADVNAEGDCKTVGTLRSEIVSKDIEKIKKDFQTGNPSIKVVFHENHERMLVHGTSQNKMEEVVQRLRQSFDCCDTGVIKSPKLKLLSVSNQTCFDLIYHYGDEGIYYQGDGMAIVYEEIPSGSKVKSPLCKGSSSDTSLSESSSVLTKNTSTCEAAGIDHNSEIVSSAVTSVLDEGRNGYPQPLAAGIDHNSEIVSSAVTSVLDKRRSGYPQPLAAGIDHTSEIISSAVTSVLDKRRSGYPQPLVVVVQDNRNITATTTKTTTVNNQQTYQNEIYGTAAIGDQSSVNTGESQDNSTSSEKSKNKEDSA